MRTFLLTFLGGLAALVVFFVFLPLVLIMSFLPSGEPPQAREAVLEVDLREMWPDQPAADALSAAFTRDSFVEVLLRLNAAVDDPGVKGVFVRAAEMNIGSSRAEELRAAFLRLRAGGKFVVAHTQGFLASGPSAYRAISAADEIWIQPGSPFEAPGITFETIFLGDLFKTLKVSPEIEQFYEFKSAPEIYKGSAYSASAETAMRELATSVWTHSVADIAADRKMAPDAMRALLEASPYDAARAVELKLADKLGYPEDAANAATARAGKGEILHIANYRPRLRNGKAVIAIVGGEGDILTGGGGPTDFLAIGTPVFASDRVAADILAVAKDERIDALVFRVDSGGGSAIASDQIWNAVKAAQAAGKKVVVSMGGAAASGGYYVSASADAIVANRSTITGSIGVFGGKFAIADALGEFGINPDSVSVGGEFTSAYSTEKLTPAQREKITASLKGTYDRFTGIVAEGRKMQPAAVEAIARGRVWSGEDALRLGLVDKSGDLIVAIEEAARLAGFTPEDGYQLRMQIHESTPFDLIMGAMASAPGGGVSQQHQLVQALAGIVGKDRAAALMRQLMQVGQQPSARVWMPPVSER
jgi:protease-4